MNNWPHQSNMDRRDFLRAIGGGALALAAGDALGGCGSGGGGSGGGTRAASGTVDTSQIGGSGLAVQSAYQSNATVAAKGAFALAVSGRGSQLLAITDNAGKLRGLGISNPQAAGDITLDATTTALSLVMVTPRILSTDPSVTNQRTNQIKALTSFAPLVAYLRQNLPTRTLNDLQLDPTLEQLKAACVSDWFSKFGRAAKPRVGRASGDAAFTVTTKQPVTQVNLTNYGWRFLSVVREDLDGEGKPIRAPRPLTFEMGFFLRKTGLFDGVTIVDLSSIFSGTAEKPAQGTDPGAIADFIDIPGIASVKYWVYGPGTGISGGEKPSSDVDGKFDKGKAWGTSIVYYILFPLIDWLLGEAEVLVSGAKNIAFPQAVFAANTVWQLINKSIDVPTLVDALENGTAAEKVQAILKVAIGLASNAGAVAAALVELGVIIGATIALIDILGLLLGFVGVILSTANVLDAAGHWLGDYPLKGRIELPVSLGGVIIK